MNENEETIFTPTPVEKVLNDPSYVEFKERYSDVYEQIKGRAHLVAGYISIERDLAGIGAVKVRTMTKRERDMLAMNVPRGEDLPTKDAIKNSILHSNLTLALCVMEIEALEVKGDDYNLIYPRGAEFKSWFDSEKTQRKLGVIGDFSEYLEDLLLNLVGDVRLAARLALTEQAKNLKSPRTP